jgi:hypothetical protein
MNINTGMYISYAGVEYDTFKGKWFLQSNRQSLDNENLITYKTLTVAFIEYLEKIYAKKTHRG